MQCLVLEGQSLQKISLEKNVILYKCKMNTGEIIDYQSILIDTVKSNRILTPRIRDSYSCSCVTEKNGLTHYPTANTLSNG